MRSLAPNIHKSRSRALLAIRISQAGRSTWADTGSWHVQLFQLTAYAAKPSYIQSAAPYLALARVSCTVSYHGSTPEGRPWGNCWIKAAWTTTSFSNPVAGWAGGFSSLRRLFCIVLDSSFEVVFIAFSTSRRNVTECLQQDRDPQTGVIMRPQNWSSR